MERLRMRRIRTLLIVMCFFLPLLLALMPTATAKTVWVSFEPELDGWVKFTSGAYNAHNYWDGYLSFDRTQGYGVFEKAFVEWDLSSIPASAIIQQVSIEWVSDGWDCVGFSCGDSRVHVYNMTVQPSAQANTSVGASAIWNDISTSTLFGGDTATSKWPGGVVGNHYKMNASIGASQYDWSTSPISSVQYAIENHGWWALGFYPTILGTHMWGAARASEYPGVVPKPILVIKYLITAPEIEDPLPPDEFDGTGLQTKVCVNISHPLGTNMTVYWYWWNGAWQQFHMEYVNSSVLYWKQITIDHTKLSENLTNYPLWVYNVSDDLKDTNNGGYLDPTGTDITFWSFNNATEYAYEIEVYDGATGELGCWVNISHLDAYADTIIYLKYGGTAGQDNPDGVWDQYYVGVYHMNETAVMWDSTTHRNKGTKFGNPTLINSPGGRTGYAINFTSATQDYYTITDHASLDFGSEPFTLEQWFTTPAITDEARRYWFYKYAANPGIFSYYQDSAAGAGPITGQWRTVIIDAEADQVSLTSGDDPPIAFMDWCRCVVTRSGIRGTQILDMTVDIATATNALLGDVDNAQTLYIGTMAGPINYFNYNMDEIRFSKGIVRNDSWLNASFNNSFDVASFIDVGPEDQGSSVNGTICYYFTNASDLGVTYDWGVLAVDLFGNETFETFSFTTHTVDPPTNVECSRINHTAINLTWTEMPNYNGTTKTFGRYKKGSTPPEFGDATATSFGPTFDEYAIIEGLSEGTCYSFSLWTVWFPAPGVPGPAWYWSDSRATKNCCTGGGNYTICFYDEDTFQPFNWQVYPYNCSTAELIIHYTNMTSEIYEVNNETLEFQPNGSCYCINVTTPQTPLFFELVWNEHYEIACIENNTCAMTSYRRFLFPETATNYGYERDRITFYMANYSVYDVDRLCNDTGTYSYSHHYYDRQDTVIKYTFITVDETMGYKSLGPWDPYLTFYIWDNDGEKIIIHQEYLDSAKKVYPHLIYEKPYWVGINASIGRIDNLGLAPNHEAETDYIYIRTALQEVPILDEVDISFGWDSDGVGLWFNYSDPELETNLINFTVRLNNESGTINYSKEGGWNEYGFHFSAANQNLTYALTIRITRKGETINITYLLTPGIPPRVTASDIESLIVSVFGEPPLYNPDTGQAIPWVTMFIGFSSVMILVGILFVNEGFAFLGTAIYMILLNTIIGGLSAIIYTAAILLFILGILWFQRGNK